MMLFSDEPDYTEEFLEEYKQLCLKYEKKISSCGCCRGPWVSSTNKEDIEEHMKHLKS